jgi:translation initiation factor 4E
MSEGSAGNKKKGKKNKEEVPAEEKKAASSEHSVEKSAEKPATEKLALETKDEKLTEVKEDVVKRVKEHKLETPWTFYTDKKLAPQANNLKTYEKQRNLIKLGTFNTLEGFWRHYAYLQQPDLVPKDHNIYLMRNQYVPAWETFPSGGSWFVKVRKHNGIINRMWEETLFACIGELFAEPDLVGVCLATRLKEDVVQVWNRDNSTSEETRFSIGEKLKRFLSLHESSLMEYKSFRDALSDGSGHRSTKTYHAGPTTNTSANNTSTAAKS